MVQSYRSTEDIVAQHLVEMDVDIKDIPKLIKKLENDMKQVASELDFERAIQLRDEVKKLKGIIAK